MSKRRWVCPLCQTGALAPSRPRKDDVRRYCLPCSKKTGRLVERSCPALEHKRAKKAARRRDKLASDRAKEQAAPAYKLRQLFEKWKKLPCWREDVAWCRRFNVARRSGTFSSGHASSYGRIVVTMGTDWADARAVVLHELAHIAIFRRDPQAAAHGDKFRSCLWEAAQDVLGDHLEPPKDDHIRAHTNAIAAGFRRMDAAT